MTDDRFGEILSEIREMRAEQREARERLIRIEGQIEDIGDHETRIRKLELLPPDTGARLTALEQLKWGLPITGITALGAMVLSAWTKVGGP